MATPTLRVSLRDERVRIFSRSVLVTLVGASILGIVIWTTSATKLIYTDEVAFFRDFQRLAVGRWDAIGIPHPPLYTMLGGLSVRMFGEGTLALRLPGLLAYLAALALVPVVCRALTERPDQARRAAVITLAVLAIHPLVLQGSLLLDIDNTVMTAALLGWIAVVGLSAAWPPQQQALAVGAAFALLLWTKLLPTPALVAATLLAVFALRRQRLLPVAAGLALGAAAFGATFALFLSVSGGDPSVYLSTVGRSGQALRLDQYLRRAVMGGGILLFWVGTPYLALMLVAATATVRAFLRTRERPVAAWCALSVLVGLVLFTVGNELPMGFPRYHVPLFWVGTIVAATWFTAMPRGVDWRFITFATPALGLGLWLVLRDPLEPQYALTVLTDSIVDRLALAVQVALVAVVLPFGLTLVGAFARVRPIRPALLTATVAFSAASWTVMTLAQIGADYATIYEYGRRGGWEAGAVIRAGTPPGSEIVAPLELVYASGRDGRFIYDYLCPTCLPALLERMDRTPPAAIAYAEKEARRYPALLEHPDLRAHLVACYEPARTIGSYVVSLRRANAC